VIHALTFAAYAVTLDGKTVLPRARAAVVNGHVLLPVRALGNALGADVGYDGRAHTITVQRGAHVATIPARGAVRIVKGSAYAPLRAVATAFGLAVAYDGSTRTIALDDRAGPSPVARGAAPSLRDNAPLPNATQPSAASYAISLQPAAGAEVHDPYPAISVRFAGAASLDPRSLHVLVDGRDVSAEAAVVGDQVLLTPRHALAPGTHAVSVSARDANGTPLVQQWSFVDTFQFVAAPAPTPFPVSAIWIDRWVAPGTNAFDVYVEGAPGITGYVGVDGVGGFFPLTVYSANAYVAHVVVPYGVNQPYARVAARLTFPNGETQTIVLPQRINLFTFQPKAVVLPTPTPRPIVVPTRRSVDVPTPTPSPPHRRPVTTTPTPTAPPTATTTPAATPPAAPARTPTTAPPRTPVPLPARSPLPIPTRVPVQIHTPAPATKPPTAAPTATPVPTPTPTPQRTRRPVIRRTPPPSPPPG
jgi:Copper amine oxidase N-terminal domain